jgi:hypothetical protein
MSEAAPGKPYSPPTDWTAYLLRVAIILRVTRFVTWGEPRGPNGRRQWNFLGHDGAAAWIEERIAEFRQQYTVKQQHEEAS